MPDCLCLGIAVADAICEPVARLPQAGELEMTSRISLAVGGCASNVAVDLAKLGIAASMAGCVGHDAFGDFMADSLAAAGVDVSHLKRVVELPTSATLVVNVRGQDRRFIHAGGANAAFDGSDVSDDLLKSAPVVYVGGFCLMPKLNGARLRDLFRRARSFGAKTILDVVVPDPAGWSQELEIALPETDVFMPNSDEARMLTDLADPLSQAERFRQWGVRTAVVTSGSEGSVLIGPDSRLRADAFPTEFVDGTGSGDAFVAGYIDGLLHDHSPADCLSRGSALGASCVRQSGATTGVFTRPELEAFLTSHQLRIEQV